MDPLSLVSAIAAGAVSGLASAWWAKQFRLSQSIIISATGMREINQDTSISLSSDEIICLDNMTSKTIPDEARRLSISIRKRTAESMIPSESAMNLPMEMKAILSTRDGKTEYFRIPLECAKELLHLIEESPSEKYAAYKSGQDRGERRTKHLKIMDSINDLDAFSDIAKAIMEIDHELGRALEIYAQIQSEVPKEFIIEAINTFCSPNGSPIMTSYDNAMKKIKSEISGAEERLSRGMTLSFPVITTNTGQIPASIAKFAVFSILDTDINLPIECIGANDVIVIPPSVTQEVIFTSPKKSDIPQAWEAIERARNVVGCAAIIEVMCPTSNKTIRSRPAPISTAHNVRSHSIETILGSRRIKYADIQRMFVGQHGS